MSDEEYKRGRAKINHVAINKQNNQALPIRKQSYSKRATLGKLEVVREDFQCQYCHHEKALATHPELGPGKVKCAKCKRVPSGI